MLPPVKRSSLIVHPAIVEEADPPYNLNLSPKRIWESSSPVICNVSVEVNLPLPLFILNSIDLEKYKIVSFLLYLVMGWVILFSLHSLTSVLPSKGLVFLLGGGIVYTIGAVIYGMGSKVRYMHSVFHVFVLAGCILQSFSILFYD